MKKILVIIILTMAVASCAHKTIPTQTATTTPATGDAVAGKETYIANCGRCHSLKKPDNYTSEEWVPLVNKMAPKAKLSDADKANVLAYVQANAKQG
jgi:mono/diheme cytochrome c family protein